MSADAAKAQNGVVVSSWPWVAELSRGCSTAAVAIAACRALARYDQAAPAEAAVVPVPSFPDPAAWWGEAVAPAASTPGPTASAGAAVVPSSPRPNDADRRRPNPPAPHARHRDRDPQSQPTALFQTSPCGGWLTAVVRCEAGPADVLAHVCAAADPSVTLLAPSDARRAVQRFQADTAARLALHCSGAGKRSLTSVQESLRACGRGLPSAEALAALAYVSGVRVCVLQPDAAYARTEYPTTSRQGQGDEPAPLLVLAEEGAVVRAYCGPGSDDAGAAAADRAARALLRQPTRAAQLGSERVTTVRSKACRFVGLDPARHADTPKPQLLDALLRDP